MLLSGRSLHIMWLNWLYSQYGVREPSWVLRRRCHEQVKNESVRVPWSRSALCASWVEVGERWPAAWRARGREVARSCGMKGSAVGELRRVLLAWHCSH